MEIETPFEVYLSASRCWCRACNEGRTFCGIPWESTVMILCPTCGNKRCPRATDHRHACTGSNDPGQPGSAYGECSSNFKEVKS